MIQLSKHKWLIAEITLLLAYVVFLIYWNNNNAVASGLNFNLCLVIDELRNTGFVSVIAQRWVDLISFIPIGILLSFVFHYSYPDSKRIKLAILWCFLISIVCEAIQYISGRGAYDVVDIMLNLLGCEVGIMMHHLFLKNIGVSSLAMRIDRRNRYNRRIFYQLLWRELMGECKVWCLFIASLVFPYMSFDCLGLHSAFLHDMRTMFNNLSYSYIAGVIFYVLSTFLPRVKKLHKAKSHLLKTYSNIDSMFSMAAGFIGCQEEHSMGQANEEKIISELQYSHSEGNDGSSDKLICKIKAAITEVFSCDKKKKLKDNELAIRSDILRKLNALFTMNDNAVDECLLLYSDVLTTTELNDLNGFKHCYDKLFYSMLNHSTTDEYFVVPQRDIEHFASDFLVKYNKVERLKKEYSIYSFYSNKDI